ncbi:mevalonate kinase [Candidatus Kaiserbacteria bacterium]|nr:mevalonate kinase [Candidatus Kaiserbacteria bacterium]
MKKIVVSAPGKLMLLGEHAVVYNHSCIVTAVGQRMFVTLELLPEPTFELEASDVEVAGYKKRFASLGEGDIPKGARFVEMAVKNFTKRYPLKGGVRITTKSEFSSLFGFGSSSASTVCVIKGLAELTNTNLSSKEIFELAYKTVLDVQGKGSGFDVAAAIYGRTLYFVTGGKVIEPIALDELPLVVGYTGVKADTVSLINAVAEKAFRHPKRIEVIYTQIGDMVDEAHAALKERNWPLVSELMDFDQGMLESLGVSSQRLAGMIHAARDAGAWGAKLSGAGGGDCMIALVSREKKQAVSEAITKVGGQVIDVATNVEGVRIEL